MLSPSGEVFLQNGENFTFKCKLSSFTSVKLGKWQVAEVDVGYSTFNGNSCLSNVLNETLYEIGCSPVFLSLTVKTLTPSFDSLKIQCIVSASGTYSYSKTAHIRVTVERWRCVFPVTEVFRRVNTEAVLKFDLSGYINQQTVNTLNVKYQDNTPRAAIRYNNGVITYSKASGVNVSADVSGIVVFRTENAGTEDAGIYIISSPSTPTKCICLYILGFPTKPSISVNNSSVGGSTQLSCASNSTTTPSNHNLGFIYSWKVANTINPNGSRYMYSTNRDTLTLSNIVKDDAKKQFTCMATENVTGGYTTSPSDAVSLNVMYGPDNIDFSPNTTSYEKAENASLGPVTCTASCNLECTFKWNKVSDSTVVSDNAVLNLGMLTLTEAGTYRCTATRPGGSSATKDLTAVVLYVTIQSFYIEGHYSEKNVTVDEHDSQIHFKCIVDSNAESTMTIMFGNDKLMKQSNVTSLSYSRRDVSCYDAGVYTCEASNGYTRIISDGVTMFVRCSPRPFRQMRRNITTDLYNAVTLSFTALAYPEPGPKGFAWHKINGERWLPLLSNADLKISSSDLQSNLTIFNVSEEDFGQYKVVVRNEIGTYEQYIFLSERKDKQDLHRENNISQSDKTALIVGISLGTVLAICVTSFIISKARLLRKGSKPQGGTPMQNTYANLSFAPEATEGQGYEQEAGDFTALQYTDLCRYENSEKDTYDVIKSHS